MEFNSLFDVPGSPIRCVLNLRRPGDRVDVTEKTGRLRGKS